MLLNFFVSIKYLIFTVSLLKYLSSACQLAQDIVILKFIERLFLMLDCFAQTEYKRRYLFLRQLNMPCSADALGRLAPF